MKLIFQLIAFCLLAFGISAADSTKQSIVEFRLVLDDPATNTEEVIFSRNNLKEKLQVQKNCLLDVTTIQSATIETTTNWNFGVHGEIVWTNVVKRIVLNFTDEGRNQLQKVTSQHIGERLAIFIDGKIYLAPRIETPISGGKAAINNFSEQEAKDLAKKINEAVVK